MFIGHTPRASKTTTIQVVLGVYSHVRGIFFATSLGAQGVCVCGGGRCTICHAWPFSYEHRPSRASLQGRGGAELVGFSPTRPESLVLSAKR